MAVNRAGFHEMAEWCGIQDKGRSLRVGSSNGRSSFKIDHRSNLVNTHTCLECYLFSIHVKMINIFHVKDTLNGSRHFQMVQDTFKWFVAL